MKARTVLHIEPAYREALAATGLGEYEAIFAYTGGTPAALARTSSTVRIAAPGTPTGELYLKRYWYPRPVWKYSVRQSRASIEQRNLRWMRDHDIPAPDVAAWGEQRGAVALKSCFLITAGLPGARNLDEFLPAERHHLAPRSRQAGLRALADWVRRMHALGYIDHDLFFRNVLVRFEGDGAPRFAFIDSPKGGVRRGLSFRRGVLQDLASLNKTAHLYFSPWDRLRFYLRYRDRDRMLPEDRGTIRRIEAMSARMREKSERQRRRKAGQPA